MSIAWRGCQTFAIQHIKKERVSGWWQMSGRKLYRYLTICKCLATSCLFVSTGISMKSFQVRHKHFLHGDLKLKCTATISTVYWKSNEESVQGSGFNAHTAPVSESRGRTSGKLWTFTLSDPLGTTRPACKLTHWETDHKTITLPLLYYVYLTRLPLCPVVAHTKLNVVSSSSEL